MSVIYDLNSFVRPPSTGDRLIIIYDSSGKVTMQLDPYSSTFYNKSVYVYILSDGKQSYDSCLQFASGNDAGLAVAKLNDVKKIFIDETNSALSGCGDYFTTAQTDARYVMVTGDTMTGSLYINENLYVTGITNLTTLYLNGTLYSELRPEFYAHTGDTLIHFTKGSIMLNDLSGVSVNTATQGQYLSYSAGTWVPITNNTDLSNYYTKEEVYNTGETYNQSEIDNLIIIVNDSLTAHTSLTGSTNPHIISFNDLINTAHTHIINDVTDLQLSLDSKTDLSSFNSHTGDTNNPHQTTFSNLTLTAHTHLWSDINDTPTTISGYGITDAYTITETDNNFLSANTSYYTQLEIDNNFLSANTSYYTQIEADNNFLSANTSYYTQTQVDNLLTGKTDLTSFNSHTGDTSNPHSTSLVNLTDTTITSPTLGQVLKYSGGTWVNDTESSSSNYYLTNVTGSGNSSVTFTVQGTSDVIWDASHTHDEYTLLTIFNSHTGDTNNPHETTFNNLTSTAHTHLWSDINNNPTTISGYGITDAYTKIDVDNNFLSANTSYYTQTQVDNLLDDKTDLSVFNIHTGDTSNPHSTSLVNLTDTNFNNLLSGQTLSYSAGTWVNSTSTSDNYYLTNVTGSGNDTGVTFTVQGSSNVVWDASHEHIWSDINDTPTTISGYGITNAYTITETDNNFLSANTSYYTQIEADNNFLSANTFVSVINTNGINNTGGITATTYYGDGSNLTGISTDNYYLTNVTGSGNSSVTFTVQGTSNVIWDASHNHDQYTLLISFNSHTGDTNNPHETTFDNLTSTSHTHLWSDINNTPTTISGYGITDAYIKTEIDANFLSANTSYYTQTEADNLLLVKVDLTLFNSHTGDTSNPHLTSLTGLTGIDFSGSSADYQSIVLSGGNWKTEEILDIRNTILSEINIDQLIVTGITAIGITATTLHGSLDWDDVYNTPTTISGYGITDAYTTTEIDNNFLSANTSYYTQTEADNLLLAKTDLVSFNSHTGDTNNPHSTSLSGLTDTTINFPITGQTLIYSGGTWINATDEIGSNYYLTNVTGSGDDTGVTFTIQGTSNVVWDSTHTHDEYTLLTTFNSHTGNTSNPHETSLTGLTGIDFSGSSADIQGLILSGGNWQTEGVINLEDDIFSEFNVVQLNATGITATSITATTLYGSLDWDYIDNRIVVNNLSGDTIVDTFDATTIMGCEWIFVVKDNLNFEAGHITAAWDYVTSSVTYDQYATNEFGSTIGISFEVSTLNTDVNLYAKITSGNWDINIRRLKI